MSQFRNDDIQYGITPDGQDMATLEQLRHDAALEQARKMAIQPTIKKETRMNTDPKYKAFIEGIARGAVNEFKAGQAQSRHGSNKAARQDMIDRMTARPQSGGSAKSARADMVGRLTERPQNASTAKDAREEMIRRLRGES